MHAVVRLKAASLVPFSRHVADLNANVQVKEENRAVLDTSHRVLQRLVDIEDPLDVLYETAKRQFQASDEILDRTDERLDVAGDTRNDDDESWDAFERMLAERR